MGDGLGLYHVLLLGWNVRFCGPKGKVEGYGAKVEEPSASCGRGGTGTPVVEQVSQCVTDKCHSHACFGVVSPGHSVVWRSDEG